MFGGKRRKAEKSLEELWNTMEMNCRNNYKDMAQDDLKEYEEKLNAYYSEGIITEEYYKRNDVKLKNKKEELKNYNHSQHIGW